MSDMEEFIRGIPKAELHVHLEGTLEPKLRFELAKRNGITLPYATAAQLRAAYYFPDIGAFFEQYYGGMEVLINEQDFYDLTYAYLEKARSQNVVYAEIMFDPQAHIRRGVAFETLAGGIQRAQRDAREELGIRSQMILCFLRELSSESAMETFETALSRRDLFVGVGLDSEEPGNPPSKFSEVFARARGEGYLLTAHCGPDVDNVLEHIRQCLDEIGVDRIDHGVNCVEDEALMNAIKRKGLYLTACPTMRKGMPMRPRHADSIRTLMDYGLRVTANTDDPAYFLSRYTNEILSDLARTVDLSMEQVIELVRNGFEGSWLPQKDKEGYLAEVDAYVTGPAGS